MTTREEDCASLPREFPSGLQAEDQVSRRWRPGVLAILLVATLIPRVWAACQWDVLWADTLHYVYASDALRRGDMHEAFAEFGLNVYPVILCVLRQFSDDWETTGKWWSVLMATLTVFPLWGWLRRMFDDRVAVAGCVCYAFHGKLIAIAPLMIRDATFIFFAAMVLYLLWRAVCEARLGLHLLAGIALASAVHTRTEGWLLCVPVVGWSAVRAWSIPPGRWRVAAGAVLCLACVPGAVAIVNQVWLRDAPHWEILRPAHMQIVGQFLKQLLPARSAATVEKPVASTSLESTPIPAVTASAPAAMLPSTIYPPIQFNAQTLNFKFLERFAKALTWMGGALVVIGLLTAWRTFLRPENLVLAGMNLLLLALIRLRYAQAGLDIRYFLLIAYVALPWMGIGCLQLIAWISLLTRVGRAPTPLRKLVVIGTIAAVCASLSMIDGPLGSERMMRRHAAVGRWILNQYGPNAAVAGNIDCNSLTAYYSHCRVVQAFSWNDCMQPQLPTAISNRSVSVIVLWRDESTADKVPDLVAHRIVTEYGYRYIEPKDLPPDSWQALVFVHEP